MHSKISTVTYRLKPKGLSTLRWNWNWPTSCETENKGLHNDKAKTTEKEDGLADCYSDRKSPVVTQSLHGGLSTFFPSQQYIATSGVYRPE